MSNYSVELKFSSGKEYKIILGELGMHRVNITVNSVKIYFKTLPEIMPFINNILGKLGRRLGDYDVWDEAFKCWQRKIEVDSDSDSEEEEEEKEPEAEPEPEPEPDIFVKEMDEIEVEIQKHRETIHRLQEKIRRLKNKQKEISMNAQERRTNSDLHRW